MLPTVPAICVSVHKILERAGRQDVDAKLLLMKGFGACIRNKVAADIEKVGFC